MFQTNNDADADMELGKHSTRNVSALEHDHHSQEPQAIGILQIYSCMQFNIQQHHIVWRAKDEALENAYIGGVYGLYD